jgi:hypothetical protein
MKTQVELSVRGVKVKLKNGKTFSTNQSLTRTQAINIFKEYPDVDRINESGGWWDRRTFISELNSNN